ncbi:tagaturonate reductase [Desmospora activa]|uniref:Tagaturonate reductase n=1 Tax=Desmospora activa DSM 45169 TaxID=1121389 RepID=A0A2T4ZDM6_9BACL|nr:tagaturonate reductase [Desmospora activa]PTM59993.1 tagaturonate reductase [Desmospora activa DSM 45169]
MKPLTEERVRQHRGESLIRPPERILQFGEGNFLRGFIDWMIYRMNGAGLFQGSVVAIQPTPHGKVVPKLNAQDGLYTVVLRGIQDGKQVDDAEIVSVIKRGINPYEDWEAVLQTAENRQIQFVFSNTTEAGITYAEEEFSLERAPLSFPGKLTVLLYHRYRKFQGDPSAGWTIMPCELVDNNGQVLKAIVQRKADDWQLPHAFRQWVDKYNRFCDTLVDRIVTGYPAAEAEAFAQRLGYEDRLLTVGEPYHLLCIDADEETQEALPLHRAGLNVHWGDVHQHRERKVRLLNGAHTLLFSIGLLCGKRTVGEVMQDARLRRLVHHALFQEIIPTLDGDARSLELFAKSVLERFENPYNRHLLTDIALNAVSKYRARVLPTVLAQVKKGNLPSIVVFSLATLLFFYRPASRDTIGGVRDEPGIVRFLEKAWNDCGEAEGSLRKLAHQILADEACWGRDLSRIPGLEEQIARHLGDLLEVGVETAVQRLLQEVGEPTL